MFFDVGNGHKIYYETYGNPQGNKLLFLHGGPGLGFSDNDKSVFDSEFFYIVFIDQRGCGRSTPKGALTHNSTQDLISDINLILNHLAIEVITVFGGSWGATLAVLFAAQFPYRVKELILRSFFPATKECTEIYLRGYIKATHPTAWERVSSFVPLSNRNSVAEFYLETIMLNNDDAQILGYEWSRYGLSLSRKHITELEINQMLESTKIDLEKIMIELYYALNGFFISEGYVLEQALKIRNITTTIIHGKYDYLCPVIYAKALATKLIDPKLVIVDAGHAASEPLIRAALIDHLNQL